MVELRGLCVVACTNCGFHIGSGNSHKKKKNNRINIIYKRKLKITPLNHIETYKHYKLSFELKKSRILISLVYAYQKQGALNEKQPTNQHSVCIEVSITKCDGREFIYFILFLFYLFIYYTHKKTQTNTIIFPC